MRICLLSRSIPLHAQGGFEKYIFDLAFGLKNRGHSVHIITKHLPKSYIKNEIPIINGVYIHYVGPRSTFFWYSLSFFIEMGKKVAQLQHEHPLHIIQSNNLAAFSLFLVRPTGAWPPLVTTAHGTSISNYLFDARSIYQKVKRAIRFVPVIPLEYITFLHSRKIVCISPQVQRLVKEMNPKLERNTAIIYNGIDVIKFHPNDQKQKNDKDDIIILFVGLISKTKGVLTLYQSFAQLVHLYPQIKLHLVGDGPLLGIIKKKVISDHLETHVKCYGFIHPEKIPEIYRNADIFVQSTESTEGFSFSILEALASGLAVIASDVCHMDKIFTKYKCGLTFKATDAEMLSNSIEKLIRDSDLVKSLGQAARTLIVNTFSKETMIDNFENMCKNIINTS